MNVSLSLEKLRANFILVESTFSHFSFHSILKRFISHCFYFHAFFSILAFIQVQFPNSVRFFLSKFSWMHLIHLNKKLKRDVKSVSSTSPYSILKSNLVLISLIEMKFEKKTIALQKIGLQSTFTFSKLTIETLEQSVKYVQS